MYKQRTSQTTKARKPFKTGMSSIKEGKGVSQSIDFNDLPQTYNETNLNLIVRSPYSVHAYWDLSKTSLSKVKKQLGKCFSDAKYYLRVYETTLKDFDGSNANHSFDVSINLQDKRQYIDLPKDNASYCADLGYKTTAGNFESIIRSNSVSSQRNGPANNPSLDWISVDETRPSDVNIYSGEKYREYNRMYSRYSKQKEFSLYGGRIPLTVEEIWAYYSKLTPLLRKVRQEKAKDPLSPEKSTQDQTASTMYDQDLFNRNILIKSPGLKKIRSGSSDEWTQDSQSSDFNQPQNEAGASEQVLSSKGHDFFFELNTELIVYGRTEPNATVTHGTQNVPLNPDGTFSLRFLLPDGKIPLNFTAQSFDKVETRQINTAVERYKTMYVPG